MTLISQLIKGILKVHQELLKYFNAEVILTYFLLSLTGIFPVILALNTNDLESAIVFCSIKLYISITTSRSYALFISYNLFHFYSQ